MHWIFKK